LKSKILQIRTITFIMSWLVKKELLLISIVLVFFSCKDSGDVGLNLPKSGSKPLNTYYEDDFQIHHTTFCDTVKTLASSTGKVLAGYYNDPVFGKVTAEAYIQLGLTNQYFNPNTYESVDSVCLTLIFSEDYLSSPDSQYVVNSTVGIPQNYGIHIKELKTQLDTVINRYNLNYNLDVGSEFLDSTNNPYPYNVDPANTGFLRIYLKNSFGRRILNFAHKTGGTTTPNFVKNELRGIAIVPDLHLPSAVIPFGVYGSSLSIFYTDSAGNTGQAFNLYSSDTAFTTISSDRSGSSSSKLRSLPNISFISMEVSATNSDSDNNLYIQGGVGIRQQLFIPSIKTFQEKNGFVLINNATLYLPIIDSVSAPQFLFLYDTLGHSVAEGYIDYQTNSYSVNMTSYLQDIIFEKLPFCRLYLQPSWRQNNSTVKRVVIGSGVQLQVYYTK